MYKHLFGPVPSRRLGMSLGLDLVPRKVCSLNCVYCEVGETTNLTLERIEYIPGNAIKQELINYFENNPDPDYITLTGSGEPTLNLGIDKILQFIKEYQPHIPVAVLTNGTLFYDPAVRESIKTADVVLPSLDAATEETFIKVNRPAAGLNIEKYIQGLVEFRKEYEGQLWLEIFILPGYNDSENELKALRSAIIKVQPDIVQLNTLDRPGSLKDLHKATVSQLQKIIDYWGLVNVEIIAALPDRKNIQSYRSDTETAILETIYRRPCTLDDLNRILGLHISEINKYLDVLEAEGKIESTQLDRGVFYLRKSE